MVGLVVAALAIAAGVFTYVGWSPVSEYTDVNALVEDLERNGVECRDLTVSPPDQTEAVGGEFGFCFIGERNVNIHVYEDPDRVGPHVSGNIAVRGDSRTYFTSLVRGSNWVVDTYSEKESQMVKEAIGGTIE